MKPRIYNLEETCSSLTPYLPQYLQEHGIDTTKNFKCLNPKHEDSNASMTCKQIPEQAFCFGCGFSCNIFQAATLLEGKPKKGKEWIEENVLYLASKYGVQPKLVDLTQEEVYEYRTYEAYKLAAKLVSDVNFGNYSLCDIEIEKRGWDKDKVSNWGIGTVNYSEFREKLKQAGFEAKFLDGIDLSASNLFDSNNLIFTVFDDEGRPVGFSAKRLIKEEGDKNGKYINTRQTGLECAIFKKGERLYGYEIAKEAPDPLYIFEGQANVITLRNHGLMNCCAIMGTALTDHHISLLKKHGSFNIVLMLDGDMAGQEATQKALDNKFSKEKDFRIKICQLPDKQDPDELVRNYGFDEFVRVKKWTAFEWRLKQFLDKLKEENRDIEDLEEDYKTEIADKMIPIIVAEPNNFQQERMGKELAKMTGFDLSTVLNEVKRLKNEKENEVNIKKKNVIDALLSDVKFNPENAELSLAQCQKAISDINKTSQIVNEKTDSLNSTLSLKEVDDLKTGEFEGFYLNPLTLGKFQYLFNGNWKRDNLFFIGGNSQAGKSTLAAQLAYEIANDPRNNAMCIYHSIDDAKQVILYKWVCNSVNDFTLHQNHVSNPKYFQQEFPNTINLRDQGYKKLLSLLQDNRLVIKDASDGNSFTYIEGILRYYKEIYPDRNIVLFVDNFHKLPDLGEMQGQERTKRLCNYIKSSCIANHATYICTAEYRKLGAGEKPSNNALAESRALRYDAEVLIHLYNDHHENGEYSSLVHYDECGNILPRIWCQIGKNKVCGTETTEYFNLFNGPAKMVHVEKEIAIKEFKEREEYLKTNSSGPM